MGTVSTDVVSCSGFPLDTYDRYVLGLLNSDERAQIDEQIEHQCPACVKGVQRSMNLWLVFANSVEEKEPAADFRGRLVRIAELSNRVLMVPKRHRRVREPAILISSLVMISLVVLTLMLFTWLAGQQSADMDRERRTHQLQDLNGELTEELIKVKQRDELIKELQSRHSDPSTLKKQKDLQNSLSSAQASVTQLQEILTRQHDDASDNKLLLDALGTAGVRLLPFKTVEGAAAAAYALVVESSKIIFVASKLPNTKHYQLWLTRKDEGGFVSGGIFTPDAGEKALVTYQEDKQLIENLVGLMVTEEPADGSSTPSGAHVLETAGLSQ